MLTQNNIGSQNALQYRLYSMTITFVTRIMHRQHDECEPLLIDSDDIIIIFLVGITAACISFR